MRSVFILFLLIVCGGVVYYGFRFYTLYKASRELIGDSVPYSKEGKGFSILVLGDSTAAGVGASNPETSIPGRVANFTQAANVENHAISGAQVEDLPSEITNAKEKSYDLILVQIGANDITRFHSPKDTAAKLSKILTTLPETAHVLVISAGDVGAATIFPPFIRPLFTSETHAYHRAFSELLPTATITYIDLSQSPRNDLFKKYPNIYIAKDGFHPSSEGYDIWFEALKPYLATLLSK